MWLTLFWLKVYTTYEVMGFFYDLNKTHVEDILQDILATLATLSTFVLEHPDPSRRKLHSVGEVMDAFPEIRWVIDATEQRIQRPQSTKDNDRQKPYYSGKKKAHPLKTQVVVAPNGQIGAVSESVSGGSPHDLTLLRQTHLIERLAPDEGGMMDKGYQGLQKDYPQRRLYLPFKARRGHPLTQDQKADNRQLARYRIVVEHTLAQMQHVGVLAQVYRQDRDGHSQVVRVVAGLVQRRIERHR
ncbi:MAG: transposase family protein [Armatimonadetes bacterium]|nr:transposase family protein [Armatimonadota bacterium]